MKMYSKVDLGERINGGSEYPVLLGGARVVESFPVDVLSAIPECELSIRPDGSCSKDITPDLLQVINVAKGMFPSHRLDVSVCREAFIAGDPSSISASHLGIHTDGYDDGFFVLSTSEPTVLHVDSSGSLPQQARPGELVYLRGDTWHSSPNPKSDGERVRIKIIPQKPYPGSYGQANTFPSFDLSRIILSS